MTATICNRESSSSRLRTRARRARLTWMSALLLGLTPALLACGGDDHQHSHADASLSCADEDRADTYVAGLEKVGQNGLKTRLVDSVPAPPAEGNNAWVLQVLDDSDTPLDNATVTIFPFMPDHGHGTTIEAVITPKGSDGEYDIDPVNLRMPGFWEVTIDLEQGGTTDQVVYKFCIEG